MLYIVRSQGEGYGGLRVLADTAAQAMRIAEGMIDRDVQNVTIVDSDGEVYDLAAFRAAFPDGDDAEATSRQAG